MSTPVAPLRILINYGNGSEVLDMMALADLAAAPAELFWWSKSDLATMNINSRLPQAQYLQSQARHLAALSPPFPLRERFPEMCTVETIQSASQVFPQEWLDYTLRWERARSAQSNQEFDEIHVLMAALHLAEAVRVLALTQPDLLVLRGGTLSGDAAMGIVAKAHGLPVLYTERGAFPQSLFLAPVPIGPEIMRAVEPESERERNMYVAGKEADSALYCDRFMQQYLSHDQSAWMQPPRETAEALRRRWQIPDDFRIVFYAAQRPADANMLLHSPHFSTNESFIRYVASVLRDVPQTALVVKPHPKELPTFDRAIREVVEAAKRAGLLAVYDREVHVKDAISLASVVVSINSTTGLEALMHVVPVVVGGESYYSHRGFTFDVQSADDPAEDIRLRAFLKQPEYSATQQRNFKIFLRQLNARHQFFMQAVEEQNGPDDYLRVIIEAAAASRERRDKDGYSSRIPGTILCCADTLMQEFAALRFALMPAKNLAIRLKHQLSHEWQERRAQWTGFKIRQA